MPTAPVLDHDRGRDRCYIFCQSLSLHVLSRECQNFFRKKLTPYPSLSITSFTWGTPAAPGSSTCLFASVYLSPVLYMTRIVWQSRGFGLTRHNHCTSHNSYNPSRYRVFCCRCAIPPAPATLKTPLARLGNRSEQQSEDMTPYSNTNQYMRNQSFISHLLSPFQESLSQL